MKFSEIVYERPDYDQLEQQVREYAKAIESAEDYLQLKKLMKEWDAILSRVFTQSSVASIRSFQDSSNEFYYNEMVYNDGHVSAFDFSPIQQAILKSPFKKELIEEYGEMVILKTEYQNSLSQGGFEQKSKEAELISRYQQLKATIKFNYEGKEIGEGEITKLVTDKDPNVRRAARLARAEGYLLHRTEFEELLSQLTQVRQEIAKANGFTSYQDYMNIEKGRYTYGEKELEAFCQHVKKELIPLLERVHKRLAERLGLSELTCFDTGVYFKEGNPLPAGDAIYLMKQASKMYHNLSDELGGLFDEMVENEYIDCLGSEKKISGMGFCTQIPEEKSPFIFGNCNGTGSDVDVLVHEFGHAFQMKKSMQEYDIMDYWDMPNDLAEVPSKAMEQLAYDYEELYFGDKKDQYVELHVINVLEEICFFVQTHEYETYLYNNADATMKERGEKFFELMKEYNPGVDYSGLEKYYKAGTSLFSNMGVYMFPRYLISYALSNVCAINFRCLFDQDKKEGLACYEKLCRLGGSLDYKEAMNAIGMIPAYEKEAVIRTREYFMKRLDLQ